MKVSLIWRCQNGGGDLDMIWFSVIHNTILAIVIVEPRIGVIVCGVSLHFKYEVDQILIIYFIVFYFYFHLCVLELLKTFFQWIVFRALLSTSSLAWAAYSTSLLKSQTKFSPTTFFLRQCYRPLHFTTIVTSVFSVTVGNILHYDFLLVPLFGPSVSSWLLHVCLPCSKLQLNSCQRSETSALCNLLSSYPHILIFVTLMNTYRNTIIVITK